MAIFSTPGHFVPFQRPAQSGRFRRFSLCQSGRTACVYVLFVWVRAFRKQRPKGRGRKCFSMKRIITVLVSLAMALGLSAGTALAGGHEWDHVQKHGHVMLIGAEVVEGQLFFDQCVEFEALPVPAHHHSIHAGPAGGSPFVQGPLFQAGNWVVPLAPFGPEFFTSCESFSSGMPFPG